MLRAFLRDLPGPHVSPIPTTTMILSNLSLALFTFLQDSGAAEGAAGAAEAPDTKNTMVMMLGIFAIFWFLVIAPERKKKKQREELMGGLKKGDKIMTTTGMYASVAQIQDDIVTLQVADGVRIKFARAAIQGLVDPEAKKDDGKQDKDKDAGNKGDKKELESSAS